MKAHEELLRLAPVEEWNIPINDEGRQIRKAEYVVPPGNSEIGTRIRSLTKE